MGFLNRVLGRGDPVEVLFAAAAASDTSAVRKAIDRGADPNIREASEGQTPLHVAVRRSWKPAHAQPGMTVRTRPALGDVADTVRALLDAGAAPGAADDDGITPLHWAAGQGMTSVIRLLVSAGADVNARDKSSFTPLHQAVGPGHLEAARTLIDAGADVNVKSSHGETALTFATQNKAVTRAGQDVFEPLRNLLREHGAVS
jgi:ankyrin repeat protein